MELKMEPKMELKIEPKPKNGAKNGAKNKKIEPKKLFYIDIYIYKYLMITYPCPKCNTIFNKKSNLTRHINKIFDCSKKGIKNNNLDELTEINQISPNLTEINQISPNLTVLNLNSNNNEIFIKEPNFLNILKSDFNDLTETNDYSNIDETTFCCSFCNKKLGNKYSLSRHLKDRCKIRKSIDEEKENTFKILLEIDKKKDDEINELKKQNKLFEEQNKILMDKIDKLINMKSNSKPPKIINDNKTITNNLSNTNNIHNNNIMLINFGKEDLKTIDEREFIDRIIKQNKITGVKIPDEVLKIIHFNPKYPQLSNIYISDINREKCMVYEDGEWKLSNIDNIPQIMDKICLFTKDQIEYLREKYPNNKPLNDRLNAIEKYNNKIDDDYIQDLKDDDDFNVNKILIKDAENFQKYAYSTIKKTLYNEGKKLKKTIKNMIK